MKFFTGAVIVVIVLWCMELTEEVKKLQSYADSLQEAVAQLQIVEIERFKREYPSPAPGVNRSFKRNDWRINNG